jgi:hypothetical protein
MRTEDLTKVMNQPVNPYASPADESPPLVAELVIDNSGYTLDFDLLLEDLVEWNLFYYNTSRAGRQQLRSSWVLVVVAFVIVCVLLPQFALLGMRGLFVSAGVFLPAILLLALFPWIFRFMRQRVVRIMLKESANANVIGRRRLTLSPEYVVYSTPLSQTITRWAAVESISCEPKAIYLRLAQIQAIVVPRHAFGDESQYLKFAQAAMDFQTRARTWAANTGLGQVTG